MDCLCREMVIGRGTWRGGKGRLITWDASSVEKARPLSRCMTVRVAPVARASSEPSADQAAAPTPCLPMQAAVSPSGRAPSLARNRSPPWVTTRPSPAEPGRHRNCTSKPHPLQRTFPRRTVRFIWNIDRHLSIQDPSWLCAGMACHD